MQTAGPEIFSLEKESDATKKLYGLDDPITAEYGSQLLIARRMVERGVRVVHLQFQRLGSTFKSGAEARRTGPENRQAHCRTARRQSFNNGSY